MRADVRTPTGPNPMLAGLCRLVPSAARPRTGMGTGTFGAVNGVGPSKLLHRNPKSVYINYKYKGFGSMVEKVHTFDTRGYTVPLLRRYDRSRVRRDRDIVISMVMMLSSAQVPYSSTNHDAVA